MKLAMRVIKPETSETMRYLMRLNAEKGIGHARPTSPGYYVGGKTGTAEKVVNGRYSKTKLLTSFTAVLPADKPSYLFLIMLDEPQGLPETHGFATSGWNAAPTAGKVIARDRADARRAAALRPAAGRPAHSGRAHGTHWLARCERASARSSVRGRGHETRRYSFADGSPTLDARFGALEVAGIAADSRKVKPGDRVRRGAGHQGGRAALRRRRRSRRAPCAVVGERQRRRSAAGVAVRARRRTCAARSRSRRRASIRASRRPIVAVTGTSGKTSVAAFTRQIWAALGQQAASLGTIGVVTPQARGLRLADDARSGRRCTRTLDRLARRRRHASRDGGLVARPRPAPARRRAPRGRRLHQSRPRPSRLSPDARGLSRRQAAPVRDAAAPTAARR